MKSLPLSLEAAPGPDFSKISEPIVHKFFFENNGPVFLVISYVKRLAKTTLANFQPVLFQFSLKFQFSLRVDKSDKNVTKN